MAFKQNGILLKWYLTRAFQISTNLGSHKAGHTGCSYFGGRKVALKQCDQIWPNFTFYRNFEVFVKNMRLFSICQILSLLG